MYQNNNKGYKSKFEATRLKDVPDGVYNVRLIQLNTLKNKETGKDFLEYIVKDQARNFTFSLTSTAYVSRVTDDPKFYEGTPLQFLLKAADAEEPVRKFMGGKFVNTPELRKRFFGNFKDKTLTLTVFKGRITPSSSTPSVPVASTSNYSNRNGV